MTMSRLDAGMWENPASASSMQHRLLVELAALPGSVLSDMVCQHSATRLISVRCIGTYCCASHYSGVERVLPLKSIERNCHLVSAG